MPEFPTHFCCTIFLQIFDGGISFPDRLSRISTKNPQKSSLFHLRKRFSTFFPTFPRFFPPQYTGRNVPKARRTRWFSESTFHRTEGRVTHGRESKVLPRSPAVSRREEGKRPRESARERVVVVWVCACFSHDSRLTVPRGSASAGEEQLFFPDLVVRRASLCGERNS